jgi:hypothetical protein
MSQKSNVLTLRHKQKLEIQVFITRYWNSFFKLSGLINRLFLIKGVSVLKSYLGLDNNLIFFDFIIFYNHFKLILYKKKFINKQTFLIKNIKSIDFFSLLIKNYLKKFMYNSYILKFKVLNSFIEKKILKSLYKKLKIFVSNIFNRRFNFFIDFLKMTVLFLKNCYVNLNNYIFIIGKIFKSLSKRLHTKFISFIKNLFTLLTSFNKSSVKGLKFILSGRFRAKERASSKIVQIGHIPIQSFNKNIDFSSLHVYTLYGVFGIKIWIYQIKK